MRGEVRWPTLPRNYDTLQVRRQLANRCLVDNGVANLHIGDTGI